ncbi:hypothetical protein A2U01_0075259, partial [Trifolium medium]|nr:hypothetical protein [Trifolium medium]
QGDLVLRRADIGLRNARDVKLAQNWEGPYRIATALGKGGYKLETLQGEQIDRTLNADKLKKYYS